MPYVIQLLLKSQLLNHLTNLWRGLEQEHGKLVLYKDFIEEYRFLRIVEEAQEVSEQQIG